MFVVSLVAARTVNINFRASGCLEAKFRLKTAGNLSLRYTKNTTREPSVKHKVVPIIEKVH